MKYDDYQYAVERLCGTFIKTKKGAFIKVCDSYSDKRFVVQFSNGATDVLKLVDLDLTPVPLGYVNHNESSVFVCRAPLRRDWRQGLRSNNLVQYGQEYQEELPLHRSENIFVVEHAVQNKYPHYSECVDAIEETNSSKAFCRYVTIDENGRLVYKGRHHIGEVHDTKRLNLFQQFDLLTEYMNEHTKEVEVRVM